jgi:hypothetical protein
VLILCSAPSSLADDYETFEDEERIATSWMRSPLEFTVEDAFQPRLPPSSLPAQPSARGPLTGQSTAKLDGTPWIHDLLAGNLETALLRDGIASTRDWTFDNWGEFFSTTLLFTNLRCVCILLERSPSAVLADFLLLHGLPAILEKECEHERAVSSGAQTPQGSEHLQRLLSLLVPRSTAVCSNQESLRAYLQTANLRQYGSLGARVEVELVAMALG